MARQPQRQGLLTIGADQRVRFRGEGLDLTTQRVECGELSCRDVVVGQPDEGREQLLARGIE